MGDNVCKLFTTNPTTVYFDGRDSYAVANGATIASYAWAFGDGGTSTAAEPGLHSYTAAGTYYATLTITDSNGKTHLTRRIVSLPDPASLYTVKFEGTSLEGAVDAGWNAKVRVFDPNADPSHFPDRAPCFLISVDSYGGTVVEVGFPTGRVEVVFFGYIIADSVAIQPEYNEVTFDLESIAGVMGRADSPPVYLGDSNNPAGEPDAWAWGEDLNVFRGLVYLLKFHSTVMDIADVSLYNDTTLTKAVDYPQDNLWNMLLQFAKGKRLMRASVTRTGHVIVGRDPNLVPVASRGAFVTVCTLILADTREQVTAPQQPYPKTSFICISGLTYDGDPSHEPNPVFGMSPGRPPKDYGDEREIQYLKLVDQTECNTLAGLLLGTDNLPYGDIVLPMRGNWVKCFDPALQEYVQTPSGGWVTKRGALLDSVKLIVRKVTVAFDWAAGVMQPTLTCEYSSVNEIAVNGDCYPTDAPANPPSIVVIPGGNPIIPPLPPVPPGTVSFARGVFTLWDNADIYRVVTLAPSGGSAMELSNWQSAHSGVYTARQLAAANLSKLGIVAEDNGAYLPYSSTNGSAWAVGSAKFSDTFALDYAANASDPLNRSLLFALVIQHPTTDAIGVVGGTGTDFYGNTGAVRLYVSVDGGATYAGALLDYLYNLLPTRVFANISTGALKLLYAVVSGAFCAYTAAIPPGSSSVNMSGIDTPDGGGVFDSGAWSFTVCNGGPFTNPLNLTFYPPILSSHFLAVRTNQSSAFVLTSLVYIAQSSGPNFLGFGVTAPFCPLVGDSAFGTAPATWVRQGFNYIYLVDSAAAFSSATFPVSVYSADPNDVAVYGASDPTDTLKLYCTTVNAELVIFNYSGLTTTLRTIGIGGTIVGITVTLKGTLLVASSNGHIYRSTNKGVSWADVNTGEGSALASFYCAEYGGTLGTTAGTLVVPLSGSTQKGKYIYSVNDGVSWITSAKVALNASNTPLSNSAR